VDLEGGILRVVETVYDGHFDTPKPQRSARLIPLGPEACVVLAAQRSANVQLDSLREVYLHAIPEDQRRAVAGVEALVFGLNRTQIANASQPRA